MRFTWPGSVSSDPRFSCGRALTRSQQSQKAQTARLALLAAGVIQLGGALAITGGAAAFLAIAGGATVVATISWHIAALRKAMSGSFLGRAAVTLRFHATAAAFLVLGALIGVFMAVDVASRDIAMSWWSALYSRHDALALAHSLCQTLGFVGLTILGTLVTFGPTIARARMTPNAIALSSRALPCLAGAVVAGVVFSLLDMPIIAGLAVLAWAAAAVLGVLIPVAKSWKGSMPSVGDGWFVGAGITWIMVAALAWAAQLLASPDAAHARTGTGIQFALLIGAGAVQTVVGSLAFLLPVVLGGGPARLRRTLERVEPSAAARWFLVNGGAVALATPSARTRTAALAIACASAAASVALVAFHSLRQRSLDVEETPPPPEGGPRKLPRTRMALGASVASIALVVAVAAGVGTGSATDPAVEADAHMQAIRAATLESGDILIAVSFSGSTKNILHAVKQGKRVKAAVIAITNYEPSPLSAAADLTFCLKLRSQVLDAEIGSKIPVSFLIELLCNKLFKSAPNAVDALSLTAHSVSDELF